MPKKLPNLLFFGIDSLRRDRMSLCGYERQTTPNIDKFIFEGGMNFTQCFSPSIPTPPGYASILSGRDCFGTGVVTLRNVPEYPEGVTPLQKILKDSGYNTTCIGFGDGTFMRGFDKYINYEGWGKWSAGRSHKAENLNKVAIPELKRLAGEDKPWFLFLRHMDPHSPYLPPAPFERMFYDGDEFDKNNRSLDKVYDFKPFCDYFREWFPPYCTDSKYIDAQYDGEIAYMDACIQNILTSLAALGLEEETLVVFTSDHGETLNEHDCYYDHHGLYECTLKVPFALHFPGRVPSGYECDDIIQQKDILPTVLELMGIKSRQKFDGRSLVPLMYGDKREQEPEFYLTEATWERKHGWRTPEYKLIVALEPDFHFKPTVELYNIIKDPGETTNIADKEPEVVKLLTKRMQKWIAQRERQTGRKNPMYTSEYWYGSKNDKLPPFFESSEQAYNSMHIGDPEAAKKLQEQDKNKKD